MPEGTVSEDEKKTLQRMQLKGLMKECLDEYCDTLVGKTIEALNKGKEVKVEDVAKEIEAHNKTLNERLDKMGGEVSQTHQSLTGGLSKLGSTLDEESKRGAVREKKTEMDLKALREEFKSNIDGVKLETKAIASEHKRFTDKFEQAVSDEMVDNCPNCGFEKKKPFVKDAGTCSGCKSVYSNIDKDRNFKKCAGCGYPIQWKDDKKEAPK